METYAKIGEAREEHGRTASYRIFEAPACIFWLTRSVLSGLDGETINDK